MDICEQAAELEESQRQSALTAVRHRARRGITFTQCVDCCESIPEARREVAPDCTRCITCQTTYERQGA